MSRRTHANAQKQDIEGYKIAGLVDTGVEFFGNGNQDGRERPGDIVGGEDEEANACKGGMLSPGRPDLCMTGVRMDGS